MTTHAPVIYALLAGLSAGILIPLLILWSYAGVMNADLTTLLTLSALYFSHKTVAAIRARS